MDHAWKIGLCFGLTSAIITTLGLIVGLHSGTHSKIIVLGGVLTIAIADAFSDALGIHVSEESENVHTKKEIWTATFSTFLSKFSFALTFAIPILLFELSFAIIISAIWGLFVLGILSLTISKEKKENPWASIGEHLFIALVVIFITHYVGDFIYTVLG
jgi:VIT1/CCC1 family predicted Fe2+/Mn2+ transporter